MFEVQETVRLCPGKPIVALMLEPYRMSPNGDSWAPSNAAAIPVTQELVQAIDARKKMFCDISTIATDPVWKSADPPDSPTAGLLRALEPLAKILSDLNCKRSLAE